MSATLQEIFLKPSNEIKMNRFATTGAPLAAACGGQCRSHHGCIVILPEEP